MCVVSIHSDQINVYNLLDGLSKRGWQLNALQFPLSIHIAVTRIHTKAGVADKFINDIKEETEILMKLPGPINEGSVCLTLIILCYYSFTTQAAIYGMAQSIPDRSLVSEIASGFLSVLYNTKNS